MADPTTESLTMLGHSEGGLPATPDDATLETFPNQSPQHNYWIKLDCHEFNSLCPVTGQPDFATLKIEYIPGELCVETKSLKFYLASYRNTPAFNEVVINRVLADLVAATNPRKMNVTGKFAPRGGIQLTVEASHPEVSL